MKLFKQKTIIFSQLFLTSDLRREDEREFLNIIMNSNVSMPENVYYNYYTTKVGYKEDYYNYVYFRGGEKRNKEFQVPDSENEEGTRVRDFAFTYLLNTWLPDELRLFVARL